MLTIGAIVLSMTLLVQFIFVGPVQRDKPVPSKHEIDAQWDNVA